jgi:Flp pilus assembly protein TadG
MSLFTRNKRIGPPGTAAKRKRADAGSAMIEFAFVMPVFLLIATGAVAFGLALHNSLLLTSAVSAGAQQLSFSRGQTTDPCVTGRAVINSAAPSLSSRMSLSFVINGTTYSSAHCTAAASNMVQGSTLRVNGTYPYILPIPWLVSSGNLTTQVSEVIQ